ncbi:MAG TPA: FadR/GntR family transcriptional regulator [Amycolatopsis sp.]|nr:FadR/GntR family transcriptional regulator [Amycolatopsis sp.]
MASKALERAEGEPLPPGMTAVRSVGAPKLAEQVAAQLRRQIINGELAEGDALPPESELVEQFGVSRPTLREAFRVLESESLIAIRRGAHGGARVQPPRREVAARYASFILEYQGATLRDVYEARIALELPSVTELAKRRTKADLDVLTAALERAEDVAAEDPLEAVRLHGDFHLLLMRLAGNETLVLLSEMLHHIIEVANTSLQPDSGPVAERAQHTTTKTHHKVVELIRARDARGAEDIWRRHLAEAEGYVLGDNADSTVVDLLY